jgi:hypothetical protein
MRRLKGFRLARETIAYAAWVSSGKIGPRLAADQWPVNKVGLPKRRPSWRLISGLDPAVTGGTSTHRAISVCWEEPIGLRDAGAVETRGKSPRVGRNVEKARASDLRVSRPQAIIRCFR